ncbi:protein FAR1-RELATED SEQUENCE 5-like isoform X2 [Prunus yedoensis var. nudiflora]|uniref:Protein FAR1-RELATED SEQUENCE 5-like isoform X2 n=1 Tax=Prunus yedoensis var. nudiflora TaxID=2094558 RepID=A0A314ZFQ8_PRUYE|nr:protein FAR1-RELATED SEQUENCE 5-like isoform X2 [Prunus yedoensis var. nudiflora]
MKKNLCLDNICVDKNSEGEALLGESGGIEQVKMIKHTHCEITKECGDSLETQKHIPRTKDTQAATRKWLPMQGTMPFTKQLQGSYIDNGTQASYPSKSFGATTTFKDNTTFTQLHQEASMHGNQVSQSNGSKE